MLAQKYWSSLQGHLDRSIRMNIALKNFWTRLSKPGIGRKIAYGYGLAIGVAILGTSIGLIVGDYYHRQAQRQLMIARRQQMILNKLDKEIVELRSHPQRLMMAFGDAIWFDFERTAFLGHVYEMQQAIAALNTFVTEHPNDLATTVQELQAISERYEVNTQAYLQWMQDFWEQVDPPRLTPEKVPVAQQTLLVALRQQPMIGIEIELERLAEQLDRVLDAAQYQQLLANTQLERAASLRVQIVLASMAIAVLMAATLAVYTSRAIARPIEAVTQVAEQASRDANFQLQAPVLTQDEVGVLAVAFNSLIQKVAFYTQALELNQQTLEEQVAARTQELQQALTHIQQTQAQLIQAEKMSSLGQLVAGVAHEINNPVNFIHGNLAHAEEYIQDLLALLEQYRGQFTVLPPTIQAQEEAIDLPFLRQDLPKLFNSMKLGADRIRDIVASLRNFSRLDEAALKEVDIHEGLDSTLMILQNRLKAKPDHPAIQVIKHYAPLPLVECYAGQLNQVFMNILTNAIDALDSQELLSSEGADLVKTITIRTAVLDNNQVAIHIADNGPGMTPEVRQRLFDPFFTTKPVGKGTGLGMSISYQIITEYHGGSLECLSEPGQGAEFIVKIPIHQEPASDSLPSDTGSGAKELSTVLSLID